MPQLRYFYAACDATLARGQPIAMLPILVSPALKSVNGTALRIARETVPRAGYHLSMALARINFLARFSSICHLWQQSSTKRNACPAPLGDCASKTRLPDGVRRSDCAVDDRWR